MLLSLDAGFSIYSPGASLTTIDTVTTLTTDPWIWNGEIQYLDSSNQIQTFSEGFNYFNYQFSHQIELETLFTGLPILAQIAKLRKYYRKAKLAQLIELRSFSRHFDLNCARNYAGFACATSCTISRFAQECGTP